MGIGDEVEITARRKFLKLAGAGAFAVPAVMGGTGAYGQPGSAEIADHGSGMFDVRAFGAKGDGTTIDTPAINRAIEAGSAAGGTVRFAAGQYLCYSIHLKSNVALYLEQGAVIIAANALPEGQSGGYDEPEPEQAWEAYQDYGHNHWHNSLIWGEGLHDVSIYGPGRIWGRGLTRSNDPKSQNPANRRTSGVETRRLA